MELTEREKDLLKSMIMVLNHHVGRCGGIKNRIGKKQKTLDMERIDLLEKILDSCKPNENK